MAARTEILALAGAITCLALAATGVFAALALEGGRLVADSEPVFIRGAMYYQPHASHHYFWEDLDESRIGPDFSAMRAQGFNAVAIQVNWGSFMPRVEIEARRYQWSREAQGKLVRLLEAARSHELYVILWFTVARAPEGVNAASFPARDDAGGVSHMPFHGYTVGDWPAIADYDTYAWRAFVRFHERVARVCRGFDNVIFDPLDWQHLNISHWSFNDPLNLRSWRDFLRRENPHLNHWNRRWEEENRSWEQVLFPVDTWARDSICRKPETPYHGVPVLRYEKEKWRDFNRWHNALYTRIAEAVTAALRRGDPDILIGQRVDPWRYGYWRQQTWGVGSVDFYFHGWYPDSPEKVADAEANTRAEMEKIRSRTPRPKPIVCWETGVDVLKLYPEAPEAERDRRRAEFVAALEKVSREEGLLGWCWWVWRDYHLREDSQHWGLVREDGQVKTPEIMPAALAAAE